MTPIVIAFIFTLVWAALLGAMGYYAIETIIIKHIENKSTNQDIKKIYISHPYEGKERNKTRVEQIVKDCSKMNKNAVFVSPIHTFGFMYNTISYERGINYCLELLDCCDEMWVFGNYTQSEGCKIEIEHCKKNNIPFVIKERNQ